MKIRHVAAVTLFAAATLFCGCSSTYYMVQDPDSGNKYYTTKLERHSGASATFTDAKTHTEVTLQNTQVMEITKDQYQAAVGNP